MPIRRPSLVIASFGLVLVALFVFLLISTAGAANQWQDSPTPMPSSETPPIPNIIQTSQPAVSNLSISDEVCLGCHGQPGEGLTLNNGEVLDLYVPAELHQGSVHGEMGYACVQCHTEVGEYPHPPFEASNRRDATLKLNSVCARCHSMEAELTKDSVHAAAQAQGTKEAAVCVDCHTAHEVIRLNDPETHELLPESRTWIPERCALCHSAIYEKYKKSVHGAALTDGNPDVPTCIDCHGVHNIEDPTTSSFRLKSPEMCAKCHTDPEIMDHYGISTNVLDTYVADFHGTTVAIFEKQSPDAEVNKPVCYDCHGIHDISRVDDPNTGLEMKGNLLARCQVCHPDANANFPSSWMSHYNPSPEKYPLTYYVNLFYKFFIPLTLGGMILLVGMDAGRSLLNRSRRKKKGALAAAEETIESPPELQILPELDSELEKDVSSPESSDPIVVSTSAESLAEMIPDDGSTSGPEDRPEEDEGNSSDSIDPEAENE